MTHAPYISEDGTERFPGEYGERPTDVITHCAAILLFEALAPDGCPTGHDCCGGTGSCAHRYGADDCPGCAGEEGE